MNWLKSLFSTQYHYASIDIDKAKSVDDCLMLLNTKANSMHSDTGNTLVLKSLQMINDRVKELEKCQKNAQ